MTDRTAQLLHWYEENRRILPWREDPSPYHVWISEIMLQQTRVEAVKGYYARFLAALPDIPALAAVPEDDLLKLWEGLGYYNRARNLKKAAIAVMETWGGEMPAEPEQLEKLPGIGTYTAGAIASIAFGRRVPAVDGNALRIWTRVTADARNITKESTRRAIRADIEGILPDAPGAAGGFNQALMDLGSMVCVPNRMPDCQACPWAAGCLAHARAEETDYPKAAARKPRRIEQRTVFLIEDAGRVLLNKRPSKGLLAGLYELPNTTGHLSEAEAVAFLKNRGLSPLKITPLPAARHIFTHIEWHMIGYRVRLDELNEDFSDRRQEIPADKQQILTRYSIPSAFENYILYIS